METKKATKMIAFLETLFMFIANTESRLIVV